MSKRLSHAEKAKRLPKRYAAGFPWRLDLSTAIGNELMAQLYRLATDVGGYENLSRQQQLLCERAAYIVVRLTEHESAVLTGKPSTLDDGVHSNQTSLLVGILNKLGLERKARPTDLSAYLKRRQASDPVNGSEPVEREGGLA